jgi:hypothetical protein
MAGVIIGSKSSVVTPWIPRGANMSIKKPTPISLNSNNIISHIKLIIAATPHKKLVMLKENNFTKDNINPI